MPDDRTLDLLGRQVDRYQSATARQAANSVQVKTWCVTAVAAVVAFAIDSSESSLVLVAGALVLCFYFLDSYYMLLERHFRHECEALVDTVLSERPGSDRELFVVAGPRGRPPSAKLILEAAESFAVAPLYGFLVVLLAFGYALLDASQ